jgi:hypothetical protein
LVKAAVSRDRDYVICWHCRRQILAGQEAEQVMTVWQQGCAPLCRCGEFVGRASAGLIIVGTAGFALAALMADLL